MSRQAARKASSPRFHDWQNAAIAGGPAWIGCDLRRRGLLDPDIHILEGHSSNLWYGSFVPDVPPIFETPQSIATKWSGPRRVFLWQDVTNQPGPVPVFSTPAYLVARSRGKEILSNRP